MRRLYFIFAMLLAAWAAQGAQVTRTYTLNFSQSDFTYTTDDGMLYINSPSHIISFDHDTLQPAMPYIGVNILVRPYEDYSSFNIQKTEALIQSNVIMAPNPKVVPVSMMPEVQEVTSSPIYPDTVYPATDMSYTGSYTTDGYKVICFRLCPFRYDNITKNLYLTTSIYLSITLNNTITPLGHGVPLQPMVIGGSNMQQAVANRAINGYEITAMYSVSSDMTYYRDYYEYVIVTNQTLAPVYERLAEWKEKKGIRTKILTVEEIDSVDISNDPIPLKIKRALKEYYYHGMKYVLLGGGVDIVPSEICFILAENNRQPLPCIFPSDLYYGNYNQLNWDTNGNGRIGEIVDNIDIIPEVGVARIPISDTATLESYIEKLITYECNPDTTNWQNKMLLSGRHKYYNYTIPPGVNVSDAHASALTLISESVNPYWQGNVSLYFDTGNNIGWNGGLVASKLQNELEKGYSFVCVDTHGDVDHWAMDANPPYYNTDASNLSNAGNTIITTKACLTNDFTKTDCLGKAFMNNSQSGVLGYWGSSTFSWDASDPRSLGYSGRFMSELYKNLFNGSRNFADAVNGAKLVYDGSLNSDTASRCNYLSYNILGEPTMQIFSKKPKRYSTINVYSAINVNTNNDELHVEVGPNDVGDAFTMIREFDNDIMFEKKYYYSGVVFPDYTSDNGMCRIVVTHPDYIPYLAYYGNTVYLQNEVLEGDNHILAIDKTVIGSQQNPSATVGPVVVRNGSTTVNLSSGVTINDSFEVELGAVFEIKANN